MPAIGIDLSDSSSHSPDSAISSRTSCTEQSVSGSEKVVHAGKKVKLNGWISNGVLHIDLSTIADKLNVTEANDREPASLNDSKDSEDSPG
jgi:hypothetical protein